jgi:type III pantothenate kinase
MGALTNPRKGAFEAIQAFRAAKLKIPNLHLILIGMWDTRLILAAKTNAVTKILEKLAKANHVTVTGWVNDKDKYALLSGANVFISPTYYEAFGLAIAEALYNKLPVIATDIGGCRYVVRKGIDGILIKEASDISSFAKAIEQLINNPQKAKKMGEAGHQRVKKLFSWEKTAEKMEKIYHKLIEKNSTLL